MDDRLKEMFDNPPPEMRVPAPEEMPRMPVCRTPCSPEDLQEHLRKYVDLVKRKGAAEARIIRARDIPQDPRVPLKCFSPKCPFYGRSGGCPPHVKGDFRTAREYLGAYEWAIAFRLDIPKEAWNLISGPGLLEAWSSPEGMHRYASLIRYFWRMGDAVEQAAFYDGHYYAINCHFGPCLVALCEQFGKCQEIKSGVCRFPLKAKTSVEQTFCIDLMKLGARCGWDQVMWGYCAFPEDFPPDYTPFAIGLILVE